MTLIKTRPLSPKPGQPFSGYFIYVNAGGERSFVQVQDGNPSVEPVDLQPGRYSIEWVQAGQEPIFDVAMIPSDKPEVELSEVLYSLKGKPVEQEAVQSVMGEPQMAQEAGEGQSTQDPTVTMQPPSTEQEVAGTNVTTKRKGAADA